MHNYNDFDINTMTTIMVVVEIRLAGNVAPRPMRVHIPEEI